MQKPSVRIIFLERMAMFVVPPTIVFALVLGIVAFWHPIPTASLSVLASLGTICIGVLGSIGAGTGLGYMGSWGGYGGSGIGIGVGIGLDQQPQGTMGSGVQTQNQPTGATPAP